MHCWVCLYLSLLKFMRCTQSTSQAWQGCYGQHLFPSAYWLHHTAWCCQKPFLHRSPAISSSSSLNLKHIRVNMVKTDESTKEVSDMYHLCTRTCHKRPWRVSVILISVQCRCQPQLDKDNTVIFVRPAQKIQIKIHNLLMVCIKCSKFRQPTNS